MHVVNSFIVIVLLVLSAPIQADPSRSDSYPNQKQMLQDLDFITHLFHVSYAPFQWKVDHFGWDLATEKEQARSFISNHPLVSLKDFQNLIKKLCLATKDYHVTPQFYSTAWATLPFRIQSSQGRYFISEIDISETALLDHFPLSVGDEILTFGGRPIQEVAEAFMQDEIGYNYIGTDQALTEFYLTHRIGSYGHEVPKGTIELTFSKPSSKIPLRTSLKWDYHTEKVITPQVKTTAKSLSRNMRHPLYEELYPQKSFTTSHHQIFKTICTDSHEPSELLGSRKSLLPLLGTVLWESEDEIEFHAYLFLMDNLQIGAYIRIPSFYAEDGDAAAFQFGEIIKLFEDVSSVLVIDQTNNGGGLVLYLYALTAMLTDRALDVPQHRVMLTQEDVYFAAKSYEKLRSVGNDRNARKLLGDTIEGLSVNLALAKSLMRSHQFVIDQWNEGKRFTDFSYMYGIKRVQPHPEIHYTKPILVLTNNLDFSAADFFAAIMQDNRRATILGTRTAGAGGYIEKVTFPNLSGIKQLDLTASFSMRPNGMPIENFGVTPDIFYEITPEDLQSDYAEYKQNILQTLNRMISDNQGGSRE